MTTTVYTDGACLGNPGPGGWAWAVPGGAYASGAAADTTNQRMELQAALSALQTVSGTLVVVSDSKYVVDCFNDRWYERWERKGWKNSKGETVANQDLWRSLVALFRARSADLTFTWVKGHSDDATNDLVDRLAVEAAETQTGRQGASPPEYVGAPDKPVARRAPSAAQSGATPPAGFRIVVLGHRPPELGGYGENAIAGEVRRKLSEALSGMKVVHPDPIVLTGLGLGAEQLGAQAALDAGVPYVAVIAFPNPDEVWRAASRAAYRQLVDAATAVITLSKDKPKSKQAAGIAIGRRNDWLIAHANGALVVWDGEERSLGANVKALEQRNLDDVWIIPPADR